MIKYLNKAVIISALKRAVWTMAEVALSMMSVGMAISDINWAHVLSVTAVAGIISILKSIVIGMPETDMDGKLIIEDGEEKQSWILNVETDPLVIPNKSTIILKVENKL